VIETAANTTAVGPATLSVIVPAYNEQATLENVVREVLKLPQLTELIIVDDGSTDATPQICEKLASLPRVRVVRQPRNQGKCAALKTGFAISTGEIVIVQDADLEYDPADWGALLEPIIDGVADAAFGSRFLGGPHRVLYFWHSVGNAMLTTLSNMFTNLNLTDMETCYKAIRGDLARSLHLTSDRFGFEVEVTARLAQAQARIYEVPISYSGRTYAEGKKIGWKDGMAAFVHIVRYNMGR
jgi:glycosyltransferase involved in cell wall biosynthesis